MSFQEALARLKNIALTLPDDDPDKLEMLSVEGDYQALMEWALKKRNEALAQAEACASLKETYGFREKRFEAKADSMKDVVGLIMSCAKETKYQGVAGTVSVKAIPPKPVVLDESLVPPLYFKVERSIQKSLINEAIKNGETIPGVSLDNGGSSISIRSK